MGFGLIFLGWSTFAFFKLIPPIRILGCLLMLNGLTKLECYGESFKKAKNASVAFLTYFILYSIFWLLDLLEILPIASIPYFDYFDTVIYRTVLVIFSILLYKALGDISEQTGFEKGIKKAKNCTSLVIVFVFFLAVQIAVSFMNIGKYEAYLTLALLVFELVWLFYSASFIYSCYMMIATQEIIDEENKKMREYDEKYSFRTPKNKK